jgi:excisionase family DNA binding protein
MSVVGTYGTGETGPGLPPGPLAMRSPLPSLSLSPPSDLLTDTLAAAVAIEEPDILTAIEVAQLLRCNVKTVYESARAGNIPSVRLGRHFRFSRRAIMSCLGECKSTSHRQGN